MDETGISFDNLMKIWSDKEKYISVAKRYLQDSEKAKDIFSDSFAALLERREQLPDDAVKMSIYLMQTVKHKCLNELKRDYARLERRAAITEEDMLLLAEDNVTRHIIERDIMAAMQTAGLKIDKFTFDIYVASRVGGLSHKELSEKFAVTQNRIAKEIMKAGKIMEVLLKDYMHIFILFLMLFGLAGNE